MTVPVMGSVRAVVTLECVSEVRPVVDDVMVPSPPSRGALEDVAERVPRSGEMKDKGEVGDPGRSRGLDVPERPPNTAESGGDLIGGASLRLRRFLSSDDMEPECADEMLLLPERAW